MKLYVGNLPYSTTEEDLGNTFREIGEFNSVKIITDKYSGRSKGFGFIEMVNEDDGKRAIDELNGKELNGRNIIVNEAREKKRSFNGGGGNHRRDR